MMRKPTIDDLRNFAISHSLFAPCSLREAIERLGFVQADPIRAPATAQDLILRHRVKDFRVGDLERNYQQLELEEDDFYAYGFLTRAVWRALHPRAKPKLPAIEKKVHALISEKGPMHPREFDEHLGRKRVVNAWGGFSQHTKKALEQLHYVGLLRIARREKGIRVYEAALPLEQVFSPIERQRALALAVANILAPIQERTLNAIVSRLSRSIPGAENHRIQIEALVQAGALTKCEVEGVRYLWPTRELEFPDLPKLVRFLAPFDPVVWDRARFEHLWQWQYRFEAYTPPPKRVRGYYALPMLWRDNIIGWVNASVVAGKLTIEEGFVNGRPKDRTFSHEFDAEIARFEECLLAKG